MDASATHENLIKSKTSRGFNDVCGKIEEVCQLHGFSVLGQVDLGEKVRSKGIAFAGECRIYEFCNPASAAAVLQSNRDFAGLLPCRLAVYAEEDATGTTLSSVAPTSLLQLLDDGQGIAEAEQIEENVRAMIKTLAS